jgi:hypothetical protein
MTYGRSPYGKVPYGKAPAATASGATGTLAKTNANDTVSASGTTTIVGTLAKTNVNDSCAASGTVGGLGITGSLATTNANDTSAASGSTTIVGSLAKTNTNDIVSASGTTTIVGSLAKTNANDTCVASGAAGAITGSVAYTNANDTVSARGTAGLAQVDGGGGYAYGYVQRKKSVKEEREELGIIPKTVKKIITKIAAKNDSYALEPVAKVELKQNLESKGLEFKSTYEDVLMQEIERNININLRAYLKKQKDVEERDDEEAAMWLLM